MSIAVVNRTAPADCGNTASPALTLSGAVTVGNDVFAALAINTATDQTPTAVELGSAGSGKTFTEIAALNVASNVRLYVYHRRIASGDSGSTITGTLTGSRNC